MSIARIGANLTYRRITKSRAFPEGTYITRGSYVWCDDDLVVLDMDVTVGRLKELAGCDNVFSMGFDHGEGESEVAA